MPEQPETHWLTDREQRVWRTYLAATAGLQAHLDRRLRADAGIPVAYYEILVVLSESPGLTLRMGRLAELCRSSRSRLSHAVAMLESYGWVSRCATEDDGRGSLARLTDAGLAALREAAPGHVAEVRACLFDALSPQQLDALDGIVHTLRDAVAARSGGAVPGCQGAP
ncbi:MarR family winged helix-turn-helix transcriptional regulator [Streptomyces avicenniae]|uniref:MarR family winged helix-turn-helix transcriptional regulator n=1 Tax=Streptomyces avicenniae TaxID=500153 RepID=UPI00069A2BA5|nr:MarR family transcriptional regulator [Streptomyces avicenniae]